MGSSWRQDGQHDNDEPPESGLCRSGRIDESTEIRVRLAPTQQPHLSEPPHPTSAIWELVRETGTGTIDFVGHLSEDDRHLAVDRTIARAYLGVAVMPFRLDPSSLTASPPAALLSGSWVSAYLLRAHALGRLLSPLLDPRRGRNCDRDGELLAQPLVVDVFSNALVLLRTAPSTTDARLTQTLVDSLCRFATAAQAGFAPLRFSLEPLARPSQGQRNVERG